MTLKLSFKAFYFLLFLDNYNYNFFNQAGKLVI